jgi:hypothetical protein
MDDNTIEVWLKRTDDVLSHLQRYDAGGSPYHEIENDFKGKILSTHLAMILEKLIRDKLIYEHSAGSYKCTIEGKIFEGYLQQRKDKIDERIRNLNIQSEMQETQHKLANLTLILAVGTAILAGIALLDFLCNNYF